MEKRKRRNVAIAACSAVAALVLAAGACLACNEARLAALSKPAYAMSEEAKAGPMPGVYGVRDDEGSGETGGLVDPLASTATYDYAERVSELLQFPTLSGGCEVVSLTALLNAAGFDVTMTELADVYLPTGGGGFVYSYTGTPYYSGGGMPPVMVACGNAYLESEGSSLVLTELSGADFDEVVSIVGRGVPVMVWTTMYMAQPAHTGIFEDGYEWYDNEHCVLVYGANGDTVLVMDPIEGIVERDRDQFEALYDACGKMAATFSL